MIVAGIDIGSLSAEVVILKDSKILSYSLIKTGPESTKTAYKAMDEALKGTNISLLDIKHIVSTGYGRVIAPFADENISEISCHAKGAQWLFPSVRTILDMGGQDCKAIRCNEEGKLIDFAMNDKCAAGTGRFLEVMAEAMELPIENIGKLSLQAKEVAPISSICIVFARSEVASLLRKGVDKRDILAGLHEAISERVSSLLGKVGVEKDFIVTGGIGKNMGVVQRVEKKVGVSSFFPDEPQIVGALGAALFAKERCKQKQ